MRVAVDSPLLLLRHREFSHHQVLYRVCKAIRGCRQIGAAPDAGTSIRVSAEISDTSLEGERKTVTALFADIKGSMELIEDLDPEEARAIVDPALKLMIDAPPGPETLPLVCFRALMIASRSCRFNSSRVRSATFPTGTGCVPLVLSGNESSGRSKLSGPSRHRMTARSTMFCSSRTLPGQW